MSQPVGYAPATYFRSYQGAQPWFPGQNIDVELEAIETTTNQIRANLALIQRDDGALANGIVTFNSLSPTLQTAGLAPLTAWGANIAYTVPQAIIHGVGLYQCAIAHTSGVFADDLAAGKWTLLTDLSALSISETVAANLVAAGPSSGVDSAPAFRALVGADLPTPAATTLGGVKSLAAATHQFLTAIGTDGIPTQAQPAFSDISGTIAASQLPNPAASAPGGVKSLAAVLHKFSTSIGTDGLPVAGQPVAADIASGAALTETDDTNVTLTLGGSASAALLAAASLTLGWTGTLAAARLNANVVQAVTNDTNVTGSISAQTLTLGWTGTLANARLATMTAHTFKGNNAGTTASPIDLTATQLTAELNNLGGDSGAGGTKGLVPAPAAGDAAAGKFLKADGTWAAPAAGGSPSPPQGRLTLTSGTAVPTSDVAAATAVYYTPACGLYVPLWNGSSLVQTSIAAELSQATTDTTKSPAAVANNSNYDVFVWSDSGTIRATRGPAWTSNTARGTGAGTTELDFTTAPGVPLNKNSITNGPAAGRGTYVGTIRSNGTATIDMKFGTAASGGGPAILGVWNLYNQAIVKATVTDTTASWTYTSATIRQANASAGNSIAFVSGLAQNAIQAMYGTQVEITNVVGAYGSLGFALDSTTTKDRVGFGANTTTAFVFDFQAIALGMYSPQIGYHAINATENSDGTHSAKFFGGSPTQNLEISTLM